MYEPVTFPEETAMRDEIGAFIVPNASVRADCRVANIAAARVGKEKLSHLLEDVLNACDHRGIKHS